MCSHSLSTGLSRLFTALALLGLLGAASLSLAGKPEWAGAGKQEAQGGAHLDHRGVHETAPQGAASVDLRIGAYFGQPQRRVVMQDHERMLRAGHCPPGLAKKGMGCMPPGQTHKAYVLGQPLPPGVVYYELPPTLSVRLGPPPAGHRFIRVAADILLIAVGTGMVIDAISDLGL